MSVLVPMATRNAIQEEIHGASCMSEDETPGLLESSLDDLNKYLSKEKPQSKFSDALKLQFLRAEFFDTEKTAKSLVNFAETAKELFGSHWNIRMEEFTKAEMRLFQKGWIQILPFRDNIGRRIMVLFRGSDMKGIDSKLYKKLLLYFFYRAGVNDIETQRKGIVLLIWSRYIDCSSPSTLTETGKSAKKANLQKKINSSESPCQQDGLFGNLFHATCPVRVTAVHVCMPPLKGNHCSYSCCCSSSSMRTADHRASETPQSCNLISWVFRSIVGPKIHSCRVKLHNGDSAGLRQTLQTYGIAPDQIPVTWSNIIKVNYFKQWLWIRHYVEGGLSTSVVECPCIDDVIFRDRTSAMYHPGNQRFRGQIQHKLISYLSSKANDGNQELLEEEGSTYRFTPEWMDTVVLELIQDIRERNGRFLLWYDNKGFGLSGWWAELSDEKQIHSKIEYSVMKEFKAMRQMYNSADARKKRRKLDPFE